MLERISDGVEINGDPQTGLEAGNVHYGWRGEHNQPSTPSPINTAISWLLLRGAYRYHHRSASVPIQITSHVMDLRLSSVRQRGEHAG